MDGSKLLPVLVGAGGVVGLLAVSKLGDPPLKPMRPMPAVVLRDDYDNYQHDLYAFMISLNEDIGANLVLDDPAAENQAMADECAAAAKIDSCTPCMQCPGWNEDENAMLSPLKTTTAVYHRAVASTHFANAALAEKRIGAHDPTKTNWEDVKYDWRKEFAFVNQWREFKNRFIAYTESTLKLAMVYTGIEFAELQRFDLEYQSFRAGFEAYSGKKATKNMPIPLPEANDPLMTGVKYASVAAVALSAAFLAYRFTRPAAGPATSSLALTPRKT
jgi:hypothetical protein